MQRYALMELKSLHEEGQEKMAPFRRLFSFLVCLSPICLWAQAAPPLQFELATVKPSRPDDSNSNFNLNPGRINAEEYPSLLPAQAGFQPKYGL